MIITYRLLSRRVRIPAFAPFFNRRLSTDHMLGSNFRSVTAATTRTPASRAVITALSTTRKKRHVNPRS